MPAFALSIFSAASSTSDATVDPHFLEEPAASELSIGTLLAYTPAKFEERFPEWAQRDVEGAKREGAGVGRHRARQST